MGYSSLRFRGLNELFGHVVITVLLGEKRGYVFAEYLCGFVPVQPFRALVLSCYVSFVVERIEYVIIERVE